MDVHPDISDLAMKLKTIGLSPSHVSELLSGRKKPSLTLAVRIEKEARIPPRFWIERHAAEPLPEPSQMRDGDNTGIAAPHSGPVAGEVHSPEEVGE